MAYVYVASSWRNEHQPGVVADLENAGHEVYDFRNPPGRAGFAWADIDPNWQSWTTDEYIEHLEHPDARAGYMADMNGLDGCDATVLVMPCGRSAHLEAGYAAGANRLLFILLEPGKTAEPELMYRMADLITDDVGLIIDYLDAVKDEIGG